MTGVGVIHALIVIGLTAAVFTAAHAQVPGEQLAKAAVREQLRDPSSAQFRRLRAGPADTVCGEYNAKNAYGGYVGFAPFGWSRKSGVFGPPTAELEPREDLQRRLNNLVDQAGGRAYAQYGAAVAKNSFGDSIAEELSALESHVLWARCLPSQQRVELVNALRERASDIRAARAQFASEHGSPQK